MDGFPVNSILTLAADLVIGDQPGGWLSRHAASAIWVQFSFVIPLILIKYSGMTLPMLNTSSNLGFLLKFLALLQDLTQDSATLTGWRRTKRSGEGKMIALYGPGISLLRYLNFPAFFEIPEFS